MVDAGDIRNATIGGILLGVGMGWFLDGILLHQILQWHHMARTRAGRAAHRN